MTQCILSSSCDGFFQSNCLKNFLLLHYFQTIGLFMFRLSYGIIPVLMTFFTLPLENVSMTPKSASFGRNEWPLVMNLWSIVLLEEMHAHQCKFDAVSYTHLDVYKRQRVRRVSNKLKLCGNKLLYCVKCSTFKTRFSDVYKRQRVDGCQAPSPSVVFNLLVQRYKV